MRTPPKGDYASLPLNDAATKAADAWDPAKDTAAGEQCRGYGAAAIMRMPGRVRISWENDTTLKIETEAGTQTRLLELRGAGAARRAELAGDVGRQLAGPARRRPSRRRRAPRGGSLRVVTTNLRPGLPAEERRALQRERARDRVLQPHQRAERRFLAHRDDGRRGSAVSHVALRDQLALQEGA